MVFLLLNIWDCMFEVNLLDVQTNVIWCTWSARSNWKVKVSIISRKKSASREEEPHSAWSQISLAVLDWKRLASTKSNMALADLLFWVHPALICPRKTDPCIFANTVYSETVLGASIIFDKIKSGSKWIENVLDNFVWSPSGSLVLF